MTDLITRLSKLEAPDREVDAMIYCFQHGHTYSRKYGNDYAMWVKGVPHEVRIADLYLDNFTGSVDAAIALAERVLPGNGIDLLREAISELGKKYDWHICLKKPEQVKELPIQVCIALLRAKEANT